MFTNILVAIDIDDSPSWRPMLEHAEGCLDRDIGKLRLVHVRSDLPESWRDFAPPDFDIKEQERCEKELEAIAALATVPAARVSSVVRMGSVHNETLNEAKACGADLVVIGPHRSSITDFLLGSSASTVVTYAKLPVLVVR